MNPGALAIVATLGVGGFSLYIYGGIAQKVLAQRLDTVIRFGGLTVKQAKHMRRELYAGRLPTTPARVPQALAVAKQAAQNIPIALRYYPARFAGVSLVAAAIAVGASAGLESWWLVPAMFSALMAGVVVYMIAASLRALCNCRRVLAAHPSVDGSAT